jgi:transcription antitermination factor NusG
VGDLSGPELSWFALLVRTHRERSVQTVLQLKGFEVFLPVVWTVRYYSGKKRNVEVPYFPSYVFCRFDPQACLPIVTTPDVYAVVGNGRHPEPVSASEIAQLRLLSNIGVDVERCPFVAVGDRVQVHRGPLVGLEGVLVSVKGSHRVVVSLTLLRRAVATEVSASDVSPSRYAVRTEWQAIREPSICGRG